MQTSQFRRIRIVLVLGIVLSGVLGQTARGQLQVSLHGVPGPGEHVMDVVVANVANHPFNAFKFTLISDNPGVRITGLDLSGTIAWGMTFRPFDAQLPALQGGNSSAQPILEDGVLLRLFVSVSPSVTSAEIRLRDIQFISVASAVDFEPGEPRIVIGADPNVAPVAVADSFAVDIGGTITGDVLANDYDPDGNTLQTSLMNLPSWGTVTLSSSGAFTYIHGGNASSSDSFSYTLTDGFGGSATAKVIISVIPASGTGVGEGNTPDGFGSEDQSALDGFTLRGNYPNPFQTTTRVRFDIPQSAKVSIAVSDLAGKTMLSTEGTMVQAGRDRVFEIDGSGLSAGQYVYRLTAISPGWVSVKGGILTLIR
jgi:hypothetical protein